MILENRTLVASKKRNEFNLKPISFKSSEIKSSLIEDKKATVAILNNAKAQIKEKCILAKTQEELFEQINSTSWMKERQKDKIFEVNLDGLEAEDFELISEFLYKAGGLEKELQENIDIAEIAKNYYRNDLNKKLIIKSFNPLEYNKLDSKIKNRLRHDLIYFAFNKTLANAQDVNLIYKNISDELFLELTRYFDIFSSTKEANERYREIIEAIDSCDKDLIRYIGATTISNSSLPLNYIKDLLTYLDDLQKNKNMFFAKSYLEKLFCKSYSLALENNERKTAIGKKDFKPITDKNEFICELASMKNGKEWVFNNEEILKIVNSENDIRDLSKILNELFLQEKHFLSEFLVSVLTKEGITFEGVKESLDFYKQIQENEEFEIFKEAITLEKALCRDRKSIENFKRNIPFINIIKQNFPDSFKNDIEYGDAFSILEILFSAKLSPEEFEKILETGLIGKDTRLFTILEILRNDKYKNVNPKNIEFAKELKDFLEPEFFFDSKKRRSLELSVFDSILLRELPNDLNLKSKDKIYEMLFNDEDVLKITKGKIKKTTLIDIIAKSGGDKPEDLKRLAKVLCEINVDNKPKIDVFSNKIKTDDFKIKFLTHHSFKETLELIERFKKTGISEDKIEIIPNFSKSSLNDFFDICEYISKNTDFNIDDISLADILSCWENSQNLSLDFEKLKSNIDELNDVLKLFNPDVKEKIETLALNRVLFNAYKEPPKIKKENIEYLNALFLHESFDVMDLNEYEALELLYKELDVEKMKNSIDDMFDFFDRISIFENLNITESNFAGFDCDFKKLNKKVEQIAKYYSDKPIFLVVENDKIKFAIGKEMNFYYDGNLNLISRDKARKILNANGVECFATVDNNVDKKIKTTTVVSQDLNYQKEKLERLKMADYSNPNDIKTKIYKPSLSDDVLDVEIINSKGGAEKITSVSFEDDKKMCEKHFESLNGVKTDVYYLKDSKGNQRYNFIITDADGKILTRLNRVARVIDSDNKITYLNDREYRIFYSDFEIKVFDVENDEIVILDLKKLNPDNNFEIKELLKTLPGDELIELNKQVTKIELTKKLDSAINRIDGKMLVGPHKFILEHELGHGKDAILISCDEDWEKQTNSGKIISRISSDEKLREIYDEERVLVKEKLPQNVLNLISYFIDDEEFGYKYGALTELVAEANAIFATAEFHPFLVSRTQILQEYFPKTIAYLINNHFN